MPCSNTPLLCPDPLLTNGSGPVFWRNALAGIETSTPPESNAKTQIPIYLYLFTDLLIYLY